MSVFTEKQALLDFLEELGVDRVVQKYRRNLLSSHMLLDLYHDHPSEDVLLFLARYPTVPGQILQSIAEEHESPVLLASIAKNPRCSPLLLLTIAKEGTVAVREALASNRLQNQKLTVFLVRDPDLHVRMALAKNPAIHLQYQLLLAKDSEPAVRVALAGSPKLKEEIALFLEDDPSAVVRSTLYAVGRATPQLRQYWADSDVEEAQAFLLTRNTLTPAETESLCKSPHSSVQKTALGRHTPSDCELLHWAESENDADRRAIVGRSDLPSSVQYLLANDALVDVRVALATNPALDAEVAQWIATSNDPEVCCALAENSAIPSRVQVELCHHENRRVQLCMAYRDDLTDDLLGILVNETGNFNIVEHLASRGQGFRGINAELLPSILKHPRPSIRVLGAGATSLTSAQCNALARDTISEVRKALLENPSIGRGTLEALSKDWNEAISKEATLRLQAPKVPRKKDPTFASRIVQFFSE